LSSAPTLAPVARRELRGKLEDPYVWAPLIFIGDPG
jgi:hypothetical protein